MKKTLNVLIAFALTLVASFTFTACGPGLNTQIYHPPAVYTLSNASSGNSVIAYTRGSNGSLTSLGTYSTGGTGPGISIVHSQNAIIYSNGAIFAINQGDNSISMLTVNSNGSLTLASHVSSGGTNPISIAAYGNYVYVANLGTVGTSNANITGFQINAGILTPISGSTQSLSAANPAPASLVFSPNGSYLLLSEFSTQKIGVFPVNAGVAGAGTFQAASGPKTLGIQFNSNGYLITAEAQNSTVSSYSLSASGTLSTITGSLPDGQTAACWVQNAGNFAYIANAGSGNLSGFSVASNGVLTALISGSFPYTSGTGATDLTVSSDNAYLYSLAEGSTQITPYKINSDGSLTAGTAATNLPSSVSGLAAN